MTFANSSFGKNSIDRFSMMIPKYNCCCIMTPEMEDLLICAGFQDIKE